MSVGASQIGNNSMLIKKYLPLIIILACIFKALFPNNAFATCELSEEDYKDALGLLVIAGPIRKANEINYEAATRDAIKAGEIGSLFIPNEYWKSLGYSKKDNKTDGKLSKAKRELAKIIDAYKDVSPSGAGKNPSECVKAAFKNPIIFADYENYRSNSFFELSDVMPSAIDFITLASLRDPIVMEQEGKRIGGQLKWLGVNAIFGPNVDLDTQVIADDYTAYNTRMLGELPGLTGELSDSYARGLKKAGMLVIAKHFPGYGGATQSTHSYNLPIIQSDYLKKSLIPYKTIESNIHGIMTTHIRLNDLANKDVFTINKEAIDFFLKNNQTSSLGNTKLIITDDLQMKSSRLANCIYFQKPCPQKLIDELKNCNKDEDGKNSSNLDECLYTNKYGDWHKYIKETISAGHDMVLIRNLQAVGNSALTPTRIISYLRREFEIDLTFRNRAINSIKKIINGKSEIKDIYLIDQEKSDFKKTVYSRSMTIIKGDGYTPEKIKNERFFIFCRSWMCNSFSNYAQKSPDRMTISEVADEPNRIDRARYSKELSDAMESGTTTVVFTIGESKPIETELFFEAIKAPNKSTNIVAFLHSNPRLLESKLRLDNEAASEIENRENLYILGNFSQDPASNDADLQYLLDENSSPQMIQQLPVRFLSYIPSLDETKKTNGSSDNKIIIDHTEEQIHACRTRVSQKAKLRFDSFLTTIKWITFTSIFIALFTLIEKYRQLPNIDLSNTDTWETIKLTLEKHLITNTKMILNNWRNEPLLATLTIILTASFIILFFQTELNLYFIEHYVSTCE